MEDLSYEYATQVPLDGYTQWVPISCVSIILFFSLTQDNIYNKVFNT